jgi:hypothetical protein
MPPPPSRRQVKQLPGVNEGAEGAAKASTQGFWNLRMALASRCLYFDYLNQTIVTPEAFAGDTTRDSYKNLLNCRLFKNKLSVNKTFTEQGSSPNSWTRGTHALLPRGGLVF